MVRFARPLALALALASAAHAQLGPTKASEIVTLAASFEPTGCSDGAEGTRLDRIVTPEGTYVPLTVPPKRVLVLTEIRWIATVPPNEEVSATLRTGVEQQGFIGIVLPGGRADANGRVNGEAKLSPGVVVRDPVHLCVRVFASGGANAAPGNMSGAGFFAKDK